MPAAPPGTVSLSCTTETGVLTVTIAFNPDSGAFQSNAITATGQGDGRLEVVLDDGSTHPIPISSGDTINADTLADDGITAWVQVHSITLSAEAHP